MILKTIKMLFATFAVICYIVIFGLLAILAPYIFGYSPIVVLTSSMEPSIATGSVIYNYKVKEFSDISTGDVITFKISGNSPTVTHRVLTIDEENQTFRTKGDNNTTLDQEPVLYENVIAKVAPYYLPKVGFYIVFAQNPKVIGMVAGIIVINILLGYVGNKKEEDSKKELEENYK